MRDDFSPGSAIGEAEAVAIRLDSCRSRYQQQVAAIKKKISEDRDRNAFGDELTRALFRLFAGSFI